MVFLSLEGRFTCLPPTAFRRTQLQTFRDVIHEFRTHPEAKSCGPEGRPCDRQTVGLLGRRVVQETYIVHVGKEANKLEEVEAGLEQDPEVIYTEYQHPDRNEWRLVVLPMLRQMPQAELAKAAGLSVRRLRDVLGKTAQPRKRTWTVLTRLAFARAPA